MEAGTPRRRAYDRLDDIDPAVIAFVERANADTRHTLRNEFQAQMFELTKQLAELTAVVTRGNLQSATDHAEVKAEMREMRTNIDEFKVIRDDVAALKSEDMADHRAVTAVRELRRWMLGLAMLIVAAAGVIVTVAH